MTAVETEAKVKCLCYQPFILKIVPQSSFEICGVHLFLDFISKVYGV